MQVYVTVTPRVERRQDASRVPMKTTSVETLKHMPDEMPPPPVFPQYAPPNPNPVPFITQKPLMKILNRRLLPRPKSRVSPVKKRLAKKKKDE